LCGQIHALPACPETSSSTSAISLTAIVWLGQFDSRVDQY
jgi:hypothetical protein